MDCGHGVCPILGGAPRGRGRPIAGGIRPRKKDIKKSTYLYRLAGLALVDPGTADVDVGEASRAHSLNRITLIAEKREQPVFPAHMGRPDGDQGVLIAQLHQFFDVRHPQAVAVSDQFVFDRRIPGEIAPDQRLKAIGIARGPGIEQLFGLRARARQHLNEVLNESTWARSRVLFSNFI